MFDAKKIRLGIAPIAWTNDDMPDLGKENSFEQCISEAALAGYAGTEIGNKYPRDPAVLKRYLEIRNLAVASAWLLSCRNRDTVFRDSRIRLYLKKSTV